MGHYDDSYSDMYEERWKQRIEKLERESKKIIVNMSTSNLIGQITEANLDGYKYATIKEGRLFLYKEKP